MRAELGTLEETGEGFGVACRCDSSSRRGRGRRLGRQRLTLQPSPACRVCGQSQRRGVPARQWAFPQHRRQAPGRSRGTSGPEASHGGSKGSKRSVGVAPTPLHPRAQSCLTANLLGAAEVRRCVHGATLRAVWGGRGQRTQNSLRSEKWGEGNFGIADQGAVISDFALRLLLRLSEPTSTWKSSPPDFVPGGPRWAGPLVLQRRSWHPCRADLPLHRWETRLTARSCPLSFPLYNGNRQDERRGIRKVNSHSISHRAKVCILSFSVRPPCVKI